MRRVSLSFQNGALILMPRFVLNPGGGNYVAETVSYLPLCIVAIFAGIYCGKEIQNPY